MAVERQMMRHCLTKVQMMFSICLLFSQEHCSAQSQRKFRQKYNRAKPGTNVAGRRMDIPSSSKDMGEERSWTGGWQASPFPSCPLGTYATELLSPDGCELCPRGRYATSNNLISMDQCKLCPPGTYNDRKGVTSEAGCTLCPPNTWGSTSGLESDKCSGRCPDGTYFMDYGNTIQSNCKDCPVGYSGGGGQCTPAIEKRKLSAQGFSEEERTSSPEYDRLKAEYDNILSGLPI